MANEVTPTSAADLRVSQVLNALVFDLLHDPTDLRRTCVRVPSAYSGSLTQKIGQIQRSYGMAAPGELTAPSNTALVDSSFTVTPARRALKFTGSDLFQLSSAEGGIDLEALAMIVAQQAGITFTDMLCALATSLSNSVGGGAGSDFTVANFFDAQFTLNSNNVPGPYYLVLKNNSFNEFQTSLRAEDGTQLSNDPAARELLALMGPGFKGTFNGVNIIQSDSVTVNTGVNENMMFGEGCFAYDEAAVGRITPYVDRRIAVQDSSIFVTAAWDPDTATLGVVGNYYPGVSEAEDARGVLINTDDA